jgi:hypothetical protein
VGLQAVTLADAAEQAHAAFRVFVEILVDMVIQYWKFWVALYVILAAVSLVFGAP